MIVASSGGALALAGLSAFVAAKSALDDAA
jgi:hypothetical protein